MTTSMNLDIDITDCDEVAGETWPPVKMNFDYDYEHETDGFISGLPEDCYEAEESSYTFYNVTVMDKFGQWSDALPDMISDLEEFMYEAMMKDLEESF